MGRGETLPADALLRRLARRLGYDLIARGPFSPVADVDALPDELWTRPAPMPGVDLRLDAGLAWLEGELAPRVAEYASAHGWQPANGSFGALDGEVLYAVLRTLRPARALELGAGWSSLVIADAAARNAAEGAPLEHVAADPSPPAFLDRIPSTVLRVPSREVPDERFAELAAGDVLFVDTTHAVRPGGDVVHLLLEVLPALPPGVVVHVHDFYRPFEYPRQILGDFAMVWQEHHLLQALLVDNARVEVLLANHALWRAHPERVRAVVPSLTGPEQPSSLWLRLG